MLQLGISIGYAKQSHLPMGLSREEGALVRKGLKLAD